MCERCEKKAQRTPLPPEAVEESLRDIEQMLGHLGPEVQSAADQLFFGLVKLTAPLFSHHAEAERPIAFIALADRMAKMARFLLYPDVHAGLAAALAKQPPVGNHDLVVASNCAATVLFLEAEDEKPAKPRMVN